MEADIYMRRSSQTLFRNTSVSLRAAALVAAGAVAAACSASPTEPSATVRQALSDSACHDPNDDNHNGDDRNGDNQGDDGQSATSHRGNSAFCRGHRNFNDRKLEDLGGNGRACSTCHVEKDSFQLKPSTVEARFQALQAARLEDSEADDPLFRPIDADDFRVNGAAASDYTNLRQRALVRVTIPLPANIKLLDCGSTLPCPASAQPTSETTADVWRSTPSVFNVNITGPDNSTNVWPRGPNNTGGYQLDGRIDTLQNQALSALHAHASTTVDPPASFLDDLAAYQQALVTPPEPALSTLEQDGKALFNRACATCHGGAGTTTPATAPVGWPGGNPRFTDIATAFPKPADFVSPPRWAFESASQLAKNVRTYEITFPDGFKLRKTSTDPGRALLTGFVFSAPPPAPGAVCAHPPCGPGPLDDWQKLEPSPLHGIAQTAPYFHNNSSATLEDVLNHYDQFFLRVRALAPKAFILSTSVPGTGDRPIKRVSEDGGAERAALLAYLQKL